MNNILRNPVAVIAIWLVFWLIIFLLYKWNSNRNRKLFHNNCKNNLLDVINDYVDARKILKPDMFFLNRRASLINKLHKFANEKQHMQATYDNALRAIIIIERCLENGTLSENELEHLVDAYSLINEDL